ncbi:MAG: hypothetical protein NZ480_06275 [Bdellovibrionaceae bacterium]|nr:hypothetical protein [Pseudobdellovibrionaceae bacterium]MDW8189354.1 hypothetical protein [Pseudobdellovibrionaceae bacterium]
MSQRKQKLLYVNLFILGTFLLVNACRRKIDPEAYRSDMTYLESLRDLESKQQKLAAAQDTYLSAQKIYQESAKEPGRHSLQKEKSNYYASKQNLEFAYRDYLAAHYRLKYERIESQKTGLVKIFHGEGAKNNH